MRPLVLVSLSLSFSLSHTHRRAGLQPIYRNTWQAFLAVAQEGGLRSLWRGWVPNCQRAALVQLGDLTTYDTMKQHLIHDFGFKGVCVCVCVCNRCLSAYVLILTHIYTHTLIHTHTHTHTDDARTHASASLVAGLVAAFLGTPADVIKTRLMTQPVDVVSGHGLVYRS